jgi:DNA polymerase-3 subunit delta
MRLAAEELAQRLKTQGSDNLPPLLLINGNEPLLVEEALDDARAVLKSFGFTERIKHQLEAGFDWSQLTGEGQSMSLFSERRLLELRVPKSLGVAGTKALSDYCGRTPGQDLLIVIMPGLDKRQRSAKWCKLIESTGWLVDSFEIKPAQFARWIKHRLQSRALRVESGVVELLAAQLEGNVLAAAQEIDKLQVLSGNGAVSMQLVTESLADQAQFDVYALTDVCLSGDFARAVRIKQRLQSEGIEPVIVVWALVREIRTLSHLSGLLQQGHHRASAFKQLRIWSSRETFVSQALNRLNAGDCDRLLVQAAHLDQTVKGQRYKEVGPIWHQIEALCAALCGVDVIPDMVARVAS